jgi:hypothetical protein
MTLSSYVTGSTVLWTDEPSDLSNAVFSLTGQDPTTTAALPPMEKIQAPKYPGNGAPQAI